MSWRSVNNTAKAPEPSVRARQIQIWPCSPRRTLCYVNTMVRYIVLSHIILHYTIRHYILFTAWCNKSYTYAVLCCIRLYNSYIIHYGIVYRNVLYYVLCFIVVLYFPSSSRPRRRASRCCRPGCLRSFGQPKSGAEYPSPKKDKLFNYGN